MSNGEIGKKRAFQLQLSFISRFSILVALLKSSVDFVKPSESLILIVNFLSLWKMECPGCECVGVKSKICEIGKL